tara:strand:+ start:8088 stop:8552 length:465 start_codon:yes stop_codon:yes gene_type:complete
MPTFNKIINILIKKNITVSTAESCTGGLLGYTFIKHKGVSKIFDRGLICYSNISKNKLLKININLIKKYGAVSNVIAKKMAVNLYKITKSDLSISTTGIAGPDGNSSKKPIGLVYICIKYKYKIFIYKKNFRGTRIQIQKQTVDFIFQKLNKLI